MSRKIICDCCGKDAEAGHSRISLAFIRTGNHPTLYINIPDDKDFCSFDCLAAWVNRPIDGKELK